MENYTVFIVTLKEVLTLVPLWAIGVTLVAMILAWRLPDIIRAINELISS